MLFIYHNLLGFVLSRSVFDYVYGFAVLDDEANVVYTENTTETNRNAISDTIGVL